MAKTTSHASLASDYGKEEEEKSPKRITTKNPGSWYSSCEETKPEIAMLMRYQGNDHGEKYYRHSFADLVVVEEADLVGSVGTKIRVVLGFVGYQKFVGHIGSEYGDSD